MAIDLEKYRKEPTATGGATPHVDINKYRKAPVPQTEPVKPWDTSGFKAGFTGALKSIGGTAMGIGVLGRKIQTKLGMKTGPDGIFDKGSEDNIKATEFLKAKTPAEQTAKLGADITQFFLPSSGANKLSTGMSKLQGALVRTAPDVTLAALQSQGDAKTTATTGVTSAVANLLIPGPAAKISSKIMSGVVPGYVSDVATGLTGARGEDRTGVNAFIPGAGTALGTALGVAGAVPAIKERGLPFTEKRNLSRSVTKRGEAITEIRSRYSKTEKAFAAAERKGVDIQKTLSETSLLNGAVDNNGLVKVDKALENFNEFISPYEGQVKEALVKEGRKVNLNNLVDDAVNYIDKSNLSDVQKTDLQKEIAKTLESFQQFNGNIIPLTSVHDTKIFLGSRNNYLIPSKDIVDKEAARFFKEVIEKNSTIMDVGGFNAELSKYYAIRDAVESLDKTRVLNGRAGKYFASVVGGLAGATTGNPIIALAGAEGGARFKGAMMERALGGDIKKGLEVSDAMLNAQKPMATGKAAIPSVVIPKAKSALGVLNLGNQSSKSSGKMSGSLKITQAENPKTKASIIPKNPTPKVATAQVGTTLTPKEINDAKIKEIFGDISPTEKKDNPIPETIIGKSRKTSQLSDELEMERVALNIKEEALKADPASKLMKYISKRGDSKGTLAEVTGRQANKSGIGVDVRVTDLGFKSSEEARDAVELYKKRTASLALAKQDFAAKVKEYKKSEVNSLEEAAFQAKNAVNEGEMFAGAAMGFEKDEEGNIDFNIEKAAMGMAGLGVAGSVSKNTRAQAIAKKINTETRDELAKFITVVKGKAVTTNSGALKFKAIDGMTEKEAQQAFEDGLRFLDFDTKNMDTLASATPGKIASFYEQILSVPESKGLGKLTPKTSNNLVQEAKKYKTTVNLQDKDDLEYLERIFSRDAIADIKAGKMENWRGDNYADLAKVNIISEVPQTVEQKLAGKIKDVKLNSDTFYHGTSAGSADSIMSLGFQPGSKLPKNAYRGGGYGKIQSTVSFAETPKEAGIFSTLTRDGKIVEAKLKPNARIVSIDGIEDAVDLEDYISYLKKQKIDAVYIGGGEKELVVINPKSVTPTKSQLTDIWNKANAKVD
jgi:hypothetical protein